jgi:hypothetical protein
MGEHVLDERGLACSCHARFSTRAEADEHASRNPAAKAKRTLLGIEIPRDELAVRIAEASMGVRRPAGSTPAEAFAQMEAIAPGQAALWRKAADQAVLYFHECINAARQPS